MTFDAQRRSMFSLAAVTRELERSAVDPLRELAAAAPARRPGEVLNGRYVITAVVGEGGMGRVYRVSDPLRPERDLALKTLASAALSSSRVELFKAEFRTMSELKHPNIAKVHDFETLAGGAEHAFTMEYLEGRDLFAASEALPVERVVAWTVEACRALQYLHSRGVIHADFKPQNVVVTPSGAVKVLDFGLSGGVGAGLLLGTPAYMAPELRSGCPADARVDLYALGITLYQLIFRRVPFTGDDVGALLERHARAPLPFPDGAAALEGGRLRAVLERLCAKRPQDRYAGANEVIDALAGAVGRAYALETVETQRSYVSDAPLVGREAERQRLLEYCLSRTDERGAAGDDAQRDDAVLATVAGVSGVGKSRLVREVRKQLQLAAVPFVEASCYEGSFDELGPLKEWSEALRRLCRAHGHEALEARHAAALEWLREGGAPPVEPPRSRAEEETLRMSRLRELADFVLDLSQSLGFVLYLNDLQWGRTSTTDFLRLLCERHTARRDAPDSNLRSRSALIVSYRSDEIAGRPLEELLAAVEAARRCEVALAPLAARETAGLIASMLGASEVPEAFSARVSAETGGNPFFIEEVLRVLMERGDVYLLAGRWAARTDVAHLELPATIAAVLERRLAAVGEAERELLAWLAVYAQPMPLAVLAEATGAGREAAARDVRRLVERQLVALDGERARPAHDKLREYVYVQHERGARLAKHRAIAEALDRLAGAAGDGEYVFERAHHFWYAESGTPSRARAEAWAERAARLGEQTFATDVAIDNYERVGALAGARGDEAGRRAAVDKLLELCTITGQYERILSVCGAELASRGAEPLERARLHQLQGEALGGQGKLREGLERLREATALLGAGVPAGGTRRRLFIARHFVRHLVTLAVRRRALVRREPLGGVVERRRELLARSYLLMSIYAMLCGDDEGLGVSFAGLNAALALGPHEVTRRLLQNVALIHHLLGRFSASERLIREVRALADSDVERAVLLPTELLAYQATQRRFFREQRPIRDYEAELHAAIELISTRSKVLYAHLGRTVATSIVRFYASRFQYRPEVFRWAEAMRGTVHYSFVQGGAAVMALIDGREQRAHEAYAHAQEGNTTPFHRAFVDASFAYACAVTGDVAAAARCQMQVTRAVPAMGLKASAASLWVWVLSIGTCLALAARGSSEPWLRACLVESVARLERFGRRLPENMRLVLEAGRLAVGRSTLARLTAERDRSFQSWSAGPTLAGHLDGCLVSALVLRASPRAEERAAADAWSEDALRLLEERFPEGYVERARALLRLTPG